MPKNDDVRNFGNAGVAVGEVDPVDQDEADDLAEGERDDGEIVAAQPQHGEAEDDPPHRGEDARERQADPERQAEGRRQQRIGISADGVEGDVAEIEEAGETDHDVQAPAQHHVDQDLDPVIVDPFQRTGGPEHARARSGETARRGRARTARHTARPTRAPARAAQRLRPHAPPGQARRPCRRPRSRRPGRTTRASRCVAIWRRNTKTKTIAANAERQRPARAQHQFVVDVGFRVIADDRERQAEGDERGGERVAQRRNEVSGDRGRGNELTDDRRLGLGEGRGLRSRGRRRLRGRGHAQTFSTSGRPRMPEGIKIRVMARIMKAATSL